MAVRRPKCKDSLNGNACRKCPKCGAVVCSHCACCELKCCCCGEYINWISFTMPLYTP